MVRYIFPKEGGNMRAKVGLFLFGVCAAWAVSFFDVLAEQNNVPMGSMLRYESMGCLIVFLAAAVIHPASAGFLNYLLIHRPKLPESEK